MKYLFKSNIDVNEFDDFVKKSSSTTFMQVSKWANVKKFWSHDFVGMYEDNKLVATALILKRRLFLNKNLLYIPRGFVIDYDNDLLVKTFVKELEKYAKKNNAIDIKIDPYICFNEDNIKTIKNKNTIPVRKVFTKDTDKIVKKLKDNGFVHGGYEKKVNSYIQPRYTMAISLKDENGKYYDKETLRRNFPKNTRNYIGQYQEKRGVEFSCSNNKRDVKDLFSMLRCTEKRQHIALRNEKYFNTIMENFSENAVLFFARVNIDKYIEFLKEDMIENPKKQEFNNNQIKQANIVKEKYGNKPLAGATIVMMPTCENGIKVASFLYAGTNTEIFPSLKITNGLMYYRLCYCIDNKCDYCDLGGVDGTLNDHLSTFKSKFNPQVLELVGEYDLVINKPLYKLFSYMLKIRKFIMSKK